MNKLVALSYLIFLSHVALSFDWTYKHLDKLYQNDKDKCLKRSELIMEYFPETASSYLFATKIYLEKQQNPRTLRAGFNQLNTAMKYARKFSKLTDNDTKELVNWELVLDDINKSVTNMSADLREAKEYKLSDVLLVQRDRTMPESMEIDILTTNNMPANSEYISTSNSTTESAKETKVSPANTDFTSASKLAMNGMPSGKEDIASYSYVYERHVLDLINLERLRMGLDTLQWDNDLARACRYHALDQGVQDYFDHSSYDIQNGHLVKLCSAFDRIEFFYDKSFVNTENIAAGNEKPKETYQQWYTSKGHYDNMFNKESKKAAVGVVYVPGSTYGYYWVFCSAK